MLFLNRAPPKEGTMRVRRKIAWIPTKVAWFPGIESYLWCDAYYILEVFVGIGDGASSKSVWVPICRGSLSVVDEEMSTLMELNPGRIIPPPPPPRKALQGGADVIYLSSRKKKGVPRVRR